MTSIEIVEFKQSMIGYINSKDFPLEIKRLVLADILNGLTNATEKELQMQIEERMAQEQAESKNGVKKGD